MCPFRVSTTADIYSDVTRDLSLTEAEKLDGMFEKLRPDIND